MRFFSNKEEDGYYGFIGFGLHVIIKKPNHPMLFSERYGYRKPLLKVFGYRLFVSKMR